MSEEEEAEVTGPPVGHHYEGPAAASSSNKFSSEEATEACEIIGRIKFSLRTIRGYINQLDKMVPMGAKAELKIKGIDFRIQQLDKMQRHLWIMALQNENRIRLGLDPDNAVEEV